MYRATKGKTQVDHKSAQDKRLDEKMNAYTDRIEKRWEKEQEDREAQERKVEELETWKDTAEEDIRALKNAASETARREILIFTYLTTLRAQVPPPPPPIPPGLESWYEDLEATLPRGLS